MTPPTFKVPVAVYGTAVHVFRDIAKMVAFATRNGAPKAFLDGFDSPCEGRGFHFRARGGSAYYGLYLREDPPDPGTVAHECFHVARFILDDRGVSEDNDTQEATAYLLGYLVSAIYTRLGAESDRRLTTS